MASPTDCVYSDVLSYYKTTVGAATLIVQKLLEKEHFQAVADVFPVLVSTQQQFSEWLALMASQEKPADGPGSAPDKPADREGQAAK